MVSVLWLWVQIPLQAKGKYFDNAKILCLADPNVVVDVFAKTESRDTE